MSKYCPECGRQLPDEAKICDGCGTKVRMLEPQESSLPEIQIFVTMKEAAEAAIMRNRSGIWSHWDSADRFDYDAGRIRQFGEKEDRRLFDDDEGVVYLVSRHGAIGHAFPANDQFDGFAEWMFYTPEDSSDVLPGNMRELLQYVNPSKDRAAVQSL